MDFNNLDDRSKTLAAASKWLLEMELLQSPQLKNTIITNIMMVSDSIKDVDIIIDQNKKRMLIYLELSWWASKFRKRDISEDVFNKVQNALPSYDLRVIFSKELFNKALDGAMKASGAKIKRENTLDD